MRHWTVNDEGFTAPLWFWKKKLTDHFRFTWMKSHALTNQRSQPHQWYSFFSELKGHSQLWDRAGLDTSLPQPEIKITRRRHRQNPLQSCFVVHLIFDLLKVFYRIRLKRAEASIQWYMTLSCTICTIRSYQFDVKIDDHCLERVKTYKYLGIDLDENLSWDSHIDNIVKKVSTGLGAIRRVRNLVPRETLIMIYKALIQPYFDYCSSVWGSIRVCQSERLQKLQNRAARLIIFSDLNIRSTTLLRDLGWDSLERRRSQQLAIILFKILHNLVPTRLNSLLKTTSSVHSHNLRNSKYNLFVPRPSTEAGKRSFQYRGPVLWNSLPLSAKIQPTISSFKPCI